jgi:hypothetical protein
MEIILNNQTVISSAIIIAVLGFLVRFFGKAITDQKPFSDNREWDIELFGSNFLIFYIISPILVVCFFIARNYSFFNWFKEDWLLVLIAVLSMTGVYIAQSEGVVFFKNVKPKIDNNNYNYKYFLFLLLSLLILFVLAKFYIWRQYLYLIAGSLYLFPFFIGLALFTSLNRGNVLFADIYFIGNKLPLKDCRIIKINNDNIRVRLKDKVILLRKDSVSKIEILVKENVKKKK